MSATHNKLLLLLTHRFNFLVNDSNLVPWKCLSRTFSANTGGMRQKASPSGSHHIASRWTLDIEIGVNNTQDHWRWEVSTYQPPDRHPIEPSASPGKEEVQNRSETNQAKRFPLHLRPPWAYPRFGSVLHHRYSRSFVGPILLDPLFLPGFCLHRRHRLFRNK